MYCTAYARWREAEKVVTKRGLVVLTNVKKDDDGNVIGGGNYIQNPYLAIANKALEQMLKLEAEFGMTPSAGRASRRSPPKRRARKRQPRKPLGGDEDNDRTRMYPRQGVDQDDRSHGAALTAEDRGRRLGPQVCAFIEDYLVFGPGDLRGQPAKLDAEKRALIYRMYEVFPQDHPQAGRRRFKRCALSSAQGQRQVGVGRLAGGGGIASGGAGALRWLRRLRAAGGRAGDRSVHPAGRLHRGAVGRTGLRGAARDPAILAAGG